jgi:hypothetical protein
MCRLTRESIRGFDTLPNPTSGLIPMGEPVQGGRGSCSRRRPLRPTFRCLAKSSIALLARSCAPPWCACHAHEVPRIFLGHRRNALQRLDSEPVRNRVPDARERAHIEEQRLRNVAGAFARLRRALDNTARPAWGQSTPDRLGSLEYSAMSSRPSRLWYFATNHWGRPSSATSSVCVTPAIFRASTSPVRHSS